MEEVKNSPYYYLSKKRKVNRDYWYAYFPDDENPGKVKVKSVESLRKLLGIKDRTKITRKQEAAIITQKALDAGVVRFGEKDPLFVDYVAEFWDFEQSAYIKRKNFKQAGSISRDYARNILGTFKKNAVPLLPMGLKLSQITTAHIENLIDHWINDGELSQSTIARVLQSMAVPLKEATRLGKIHHNPMLAVDTVSAKPKERGILTDSEIVQLFSLMQETDDIEGSAQFLILVGRDEQGFTGLVECAQQAQDLPARLRIEPGQRLIEQEDLRADRQNGSQCNLTALTAAEFRSEAILVGVKVQPNRVHRFPHDVRQPAIVA